MKVTLKVDSWNLKDAISTCIAHILEDKGVVIQSDDSWSGQCYQELESDAAYEAAHAEVALQITAVMKQFFSQEGEFDIELDLKDKTCKLLAQPKPVPPMKITKAAKKATKKKATVSQ